MKHRTLVEQLSAPLERRVTPSKRFTWSQNVVEASKPETHSFQESAERVEPAERVEGRLAPINLRKARADIKKVREAKKLAGGYK